MQNLLQLLITYLGPVVLTLIVLFVILKSFANAGPKQYITLEKRWFGKTMTNGRTVALKGEIGLQAKILGPGPHFFIPFITRAKKNNVVVVGPTQMMALEAVTGKDLPIGQFFGKPVECNNFQDGEAFLKNDGQKGYQSALLPPGEYMINPNLFKWIITDEVVVGEGEVGMIEATAGNPIPAGRIFADPVECKNFQDAELFFNNGGQKGPQISILTPGKYRIHPFVFKFHLDDITVVPGGCVGTVEAVDGDSIPDGNLLAKKIDGHKNFEKGDIFIENGGQKGRQLQILMPGSYRINTMLFKVKTDNLWVKVDTDKIGIVTVLEGKPITDPAKIAADEVDLALHGNFQDAAAFLKSGGQKGLQIPVLRAGNYAINPWFAAVDIADMVKVDIGFCAVVTNFVGDEGVDVSGEDVNAKIVENGKKGIWANPLEPGKHPLNTKICKVDIVPTTQILLNWADLRSSAHKFDSNLKTIVLRTADAFSVSMDVSVIIHIPMKNAPKVVANLGSIENMISQVLEPAISSHFRNSAQYINALKLYTERKELQEKAKEHIDAVLKVHHIDSKDTLIADIVLPPELIKPVTDRQIAEQEKQTYKTQGEAQDERRTLENARAQADMQPEVVKSERNVEIAKNVAEGKVKEAEGLKTSAILKAQGSAEAVKLEAGGNAEATKVNAQANAEARTVIGEAEGKAIESVGLANAKVVLETGKANGESFKLQVAAMGAGNFGMVKVLEQIANGNIKLIPENLVIGGGNGEGGMLNNFIGLGMLEKLTGKSFQEMTKEAAKPADEAK